MNITVREFFTNINVTDNVVFIEHGTDKELFTILRNFDQVTIDKIQEEILDRKIKFICGASTKYKLAVYVEPIGNEG